MAAQFADSLLSLLYTWQPYMGLCETASRPYTQIQRPQPLPDQESSCSHRLLP